MRISWSDERFRGIVWQVLVVAIVAAVFYWLWSNTVRNLEVRRIASGWGFLGREAGLPIAAFQHARTEYGRLDHQHSIQERFFKHIKVAVRRAACVLRACNPCIRSLVIDSRRPSSACTRSRSLTTSPRYVHYCAQFSLSLCLG